MIDTKLARSLILLSLLVLIAIVYAPGLNGPFVLDDASNIPQTKIDKLTLSSVSEVAFDNTSGMFGRPIPVATFALNHYFGDGTPYAFKATNLAIHLLNAILVFLFIQLLISVFSRKNNPVSRKSIYLFSLTVAFWMRYAV